MNVGLPTWSQISIYGRTLSYFDVGTGDKSSGFYFQGALHGNETFSTPVLLSMIKLLANHVPDVPVRIVPCCNPWGFNELRHGLGGRYSSTTGKDWNRIFFDDHLSEQSVESQLASELIDLSKEFGTIVDVHTPACGLSHVYIGTGEPTFSALADLPHVIATGTPESFEDYHRSQGKRSITIELPSYGIPTVADVESWRDRLIALVDEDPLSRSNPTRLGRLVDIISPLDGIPILYFRVGDEVSAGARLVDIMAPDESSELLAEFNCFPLCFQRPPIAIAGSWIMRVFEE